MAPKRVTHTFRKGDILEVKEYHDGRYGARGLPREKKRKPTPEQMAVVNAMNKAETASPIRTRSSVDSGALTDIEYVIAAPEA